MNPDELYHHGVKGQKWGIRRWQNKDGSLTPSGIERLGRKNLQKARTSNLEKWGQDQKHNVMYIAGYSGSGKSTTAISLAKSGDKVIHLDAYSEPESGSTIAIRNKDFNRYLDANVPQWRRMSNATPDGSNHTMKLHSKEYWKTVDSFRNAIESYGELQFKKGHRVIAEGVQISDDWLIEDKKYYSDKPTVVLGTNSIVSMQRAFERDGRGNLIKGLKNLDSAKEYVQWYVNSNKRLNNLANTIDAKRGEKWIKRYFSS